MRLRREAITAATFVALACGGGRAATQDVPAPPGSATDLPIGYGTLRRDDIQVRFATGTVEIQILPLAEDVIRLLAPDTYRALSDLIQSRRQEIDAAATRAGITDPTLVMVSFLGVVQQARFTPEDLTLTSRGRLFRPVGIVPITPDWSSYQLDARVQARAIYLYENGISFREQLRMSYQSFTSDAWGRALATLDRERSAVLLRARAGTPPTPQADSTRKP